MWKYKPDNKICASAIGACANANACNGAMKAEHMLNNMIIVPDTFALNNVIKAWINTRLYNAGSIAESMWFKHANIDNDNNNKGNDNKNITPDRILCTIHQVSSLIK